MLNKANCPYGRASQGAAYTLLAKLYLNAEVYTQTSKYNECIKACKKVIEQGYQLESDYYKLFNADNLHPPGRRNQSRVMGIIHLHCLWRSEQHVRKTDTGRLRCKIRMGYVPCTRRNSSTFLR